MTVCRIGVKWNESINKIRKGLELTNGNCILWTKGCDLAIRATTDLVIWNWDPKNGEIRLPFNMCFGYTLRLQAWFWCVCVPSCVWLFVTLWTTARHIPLSMGPSQQEYWSRLPFPPPRNLSNLGIKPVSPKFPALQVDSLHWATEWSCSVMSDSLRPHGL